ncbi:hypothetical protein [Rhizobium sp. WYJ-E13]|uniref:hypothetical protein n=1 Tax=unclassified Rhizobium TaxID=2613769 RepID=UPI001C1F0973|nr:hypothetical protein [Rhizobium sp. WYJ-E13]QWW67666.1 hypothetical protein KQ933_19020 [Rhizobium sp. WYJ-E13]
MAHILLNSAVAVLIATAFLTTAIAALRSQDRAFQKVPVKANRRYHPNADTIKETENRVTVNI